MPSSSYEEFNQITSGHKELASAIQSLGYLLDQDNFHSTALYIAELTKADNLKEHEEQLTAIRGYEGPIPRTPDGEVLEALFVYYLQNGHDMLIEPNPDSMPGFSLRNINQYPQILHCCSNLLDYFSDRISRHKYVESITFVFDGDLVWIQRIYGDKINRILFLRNRTQGVTRLLFSDVPSFSELKQRGAKFIHILPCYNLRIADADLEELDWYLGDLIEIKRQRNEGSVMVKIEKKLDQPPKYVDVQRAIYILEKNIKKLSQ